MVFPFHLFFLQSIKGKQAGRRIMRATTTQLASRALHLHNI